MSFGEKWIPSFFSIAVRYVGNFFFNFTSYDEVTLSLDKDDPVGNIASQSYHCHVPSITCSRVYQRTVAVWYDKRQDVMEVGSVLIQTFILCYHQQSAAGCCALPILALIQSVTRIHGPNSDLRHPARIWLLKLVGVVLSGLDAYHLTASLNPLSPPCLSTFAVSLLCCLMKPNYEWNTSIGFSQWSHENKSFTSFIHGYGRGTMEEYKAQWCKETETGVLVCVKTPIQSKKQHNSSVTRVSIKWVWYLLLSSTNTPRLSEGQLFISVMVFCLWSWDSEHECLFTDYDLCLHLKSIPHLYPPPSTPVPLCKTGGILQSYFLQVFLLFWYTSDKALIAAYLLSCIS